MGKGVKRWGTGRMSECSSVPKRHFIGIACFCESLKTAIFSFSRKRGALSLFSSPAAIRQMN
jgi:hypothetical protein